MPLGKTVSRSNVPQNVALRWNIEKAAIEFGMTPVMLSRALAQISAVPGEDGCYTTAQICEALFGVMHQEKIATQKEIRKRYTLENQITTASVLNRAELERVFAAIADAFVSRVMLVQGLSRQEKEDLLKDLATWPLALEEVAHAQGRLPNVKGPRSGEDQSEAKAVARPGWMARSTRR
jgi:hypothetical protein